MTPDHAFFNPPRRVSLRRVALFGLLLLAALATAHADPMQPLIGRTAPADGAPPANATDAAGATSAEPRPRLSATRRDSGGRWEALLGTQWLRAGDRHDGARVQSVGANELVLTRDGQRETLFLLPPLTPSIDSAPSPLRRAGLPPRALAASASGS